MLFSQESFNSFIIDNGIIGFFKEPITLKSGRKSNWYVNWRTATNDAFLLDQLTNFILQFVKTKGISFSCFYGVPEGATKTAVIAQFKYAKSSSEFSKGSFPVPMGRGKPKEHGDPKDKYFVGQPKGKVIVLEDVTTTGGSLLNAIQSLKEAGIEIAAAIGLTNRMELRDDGKSVKEAVESLGIPYYEMSRATELLPLAYKKLNPGKEIAEAIAREFKSYGVEEIGF